MNTRKEMIRRYQLAHQKLSAQLAAWKRDTIAADPNGRHAQEFAHEVAALAENEKEEILLTA